jgi:phenylpyruvate tautomerase
MPLLKIVTSAEPSATAAASLLSALSKLVAERLGKPEAYMMTVLEPRAQLTFGGTSEPACYVELKSIGRFSSELTKLLSLELCAHLQAELGVPASRIYIEFTESVGHLWGYDGGTFG